MTRRTKIVATIGPASDSEETLRQLILAGVDVCRLGLAHGMIDEHRQRIKRIRKVAGELRRPIAVLGDLPGPKIRMGPVIEEGGLFLAEGQRIEIRGFIVWDFAHRAEEFRREVGAWVADGTMRTLEHRVEGLENAPAALVDLLAGRNTGKVVVRVAEDAPA